MKIEVPDDCFCEEELKNTPKRWARFMNEWLHEDGKFNFTTFPNPGVDQMIVVKDITFYSMCSHHLIPFFGKAHIVYIPTERIAGLSKFARVVDKFAHKPQLQERLTQEIVNFLQEELQPLGVMVVIEAEHLCMSMRGIKRPGHKTITSCLKGVFRDKPEAREEALRLIK